MCSCEFWEFLQYKNLSSSLELLFLYHLVRIDQNRRPRLYFFQDSIVGSYCNTEISVGAVSLYQSQLDKSRKGNAGGNERSNEEVHWALCIMESTSSPHLLASVVSTQKRIQLQMGLDHPYFEQYLSVKLPLGKSRYGNF